MSRFFPNAKRSLNSVLNLITDLLAQSPERRGPVPAKTAGLRSGEAGPTETIERLRPFLSHPLVLFWRWKSQAGRPRLPEGIRQLIVQMAQGNPTWGQARVAAELSVKLGIYVSPAAPARQQSRYIRLSGRCASRIGQTSKLYGIFAQHSCAALAPPL